MNKFILSIIIFMPILAEESFLVPEKKPKASLNTLKQDIAQLCGDIVKQLSHKIALEANLQHILCQNIEQIMYNDKTSIFNKSSKDQLSLYKSNLTKIKTENDIEIGHLKKSLRLLQAEKIEQR